MEPSLYYSLTQEITESEMSEIDGLIQKITQKRELTDLLSAQDWHSGFQRLSPYRLQASTSLKRGSREAWINANTFVANKVANEQFPKEQDVILINAILREKPEITIRTIDVFIGPHRACTPEVLPSFLEYFYKNVLTVENQSHPLVVAALTRYWLISLHPFEDANGRTSALIADWLLLSRGYLPLSFERQLDAIIGNLDGSRVSATPGQAIIKTLRCVLHSYKLILDI